MTLRSGWIPTRFTQVSTENVQARKTLCVERVRRETRRSFLQAKYVSALNHCPRSVAIYRTVLRAHKACVARLLSNTHAIGVFGISW